MQASAYICTKGCHNWIILRPEVRPYFTCLTCTLTSGRYACFASHRPLPVQEFMKVVLEFLDRPEGAECTVGMTEGVFSKEGFGTDSHRNRPFDRKKKAT